MSTPRTPTVLATMLGGGILHRVTTAVYRHMALGAFLALLCSPSVVVVVLLTPVASNAVLYAAAFLPVAPALAAGLYAIRRWRDDADDGPFALLWRGLRLNTADVVRWWVPALVLGAVLGFNITGGVAGAGAQLVQPLSLVLAVVLLLVCGHALLLTSAFSFRTRDVVRIAVHLVGAQWRTTLLFCSLLVVAAGITYLGSEAFLVLLAWAFVSVLELASRPTITATRKRFTTSAG